MFDEDDVPGTWGCSSCDCLSFNTAWLNTFGVRLCETCKREEKLIAKGQAKEAFLLTDRDLLRLGTLTKTNPQHKSWKPMQLYLQSQVVEVAQHKHGSVEQLEQLRQDRTETRLSRRASKRRQEATEDEQHEGDMGEASAVQHGSNLQGRSASAPQSAALRQVRSRLEEEYSQGQATMTLQSERSHVAELTEQRPRVKDSEELEVEEF